MLLEITEVTSCMGDAADRDSGVIPDPGLLSVLPPIAEAYFSGRLHSYWSLFSTGL